MLIKLSLKRTSVYDVGSQSNLNHFHVLPEGTCLVMFTVVSVVSRLTMWWGGRRGVSGNVVCAAVVGGR